MLLRRTIREELSINLTPMIDVVFLLLIFFMVSTQFTSEKTVTVTLPEAASAQKVELGIQPVIFTLMPGGKLQISDQIIDLRSTEVLRTQLQSIGLQNTESVVIRADRDVAHKYVMQVIDTLRLMGIEQFEISTRAEAKSEI